MPSRTENALVDGNGKINNARDEELSAVMRIITKLDDRELDYRFVAWSLIFVLYIRGITPLRLRLMLIRSPNTNHTTRI